MDEFLSRTPEVNVLAAAEAVAESEEASIRIKDPRVAQLLIALHQVDRWVRDQEAVSNDEIEVLVGQAILSCGFTNLDEAQALITPLLDVLPPSHRACP